jgi:hypothetical protein
LTRFSLPSLLYDEVNASRLSLSSSMPKQHKNIKQKNTKHKTQNNKKQNAFFLVLVITRDMNEYLYL